MGTRLLVHVGLNKAGSSTIQDWLVMNRKVLAAHGIHHDPLRPDGASLDGLHGFHGVVYAASDRWERDRKLRDRHGIATPADMAAQAAAFRGRVERSLRRSGGLHVVSSELIANRLDRPELIRDLDAWLRGHADEACHVLYLRDQVDWLASAYAEAITRGWTHSLDAHLARHGQADHHALVRRWAKAVGPARIEVRLLEPDFLTGGDLVADFAGLLGLDPALTRRPGRANEALPARRLALLRATNRLGALLERRGLRGAKARLARWTGRWAALAGGGKLRLSEAQARQVRALNAESNERLRAWLFPDRPALFPGRAAARPDQRAARPEAAVTMAMMTRPVRISLMPAPSP